MPIALTSSSTERVGERIRSPLHIGLLDDRGERLLGHPARLQEAGEVAALPELRNAQLDGARAGLPVARPVAVAVVEAIGAPLAVPGAGQPCDLKIHQSLCGKRDHVAQQIGVRTLLQKCLKAHHVIGHRRVLGSRGRLATKTLPKIRDDHRCG
jgi:hypothetical protein